MPSSPSQVCNHDECFNIEALMDRSGTPFLFSDPNFIVFEHGFREPEQNPSEPCAGGAKPLESLRMIWTAKIERQERDKALFEANDGTVEFTPEEIEGLLLEKMQRGNPLQMVDFIKRLKLCLRWYKRVEEGYVQKIEKLESDLQYAEKRCMDTGIAFTSGRKTKRAE